MKRTVFYSWQSDLPNATNRTLIEVALKDAAKEIEADASVGIEPVIDRDTQGAAGAPDISTTIFAKITEADLFVADISFIGKSKSGKKFLPNPNVLIELGYALRAKGSEGLILVFNTAYGKIENLPFDLKMRRVLTYHSAEGDTDRSAVKAELTKDFKAALISGFGSTSSTPAPISISEMVQRNTPDKIIHLRRHLNQVLQELDALQPKMHRDGGTAEELIAAIALTEPICAAFAELIETIVLMNDMDSAQEMFRWFSKILERYRPEGNENGRTSSADGDFFKFVGDELFVLFALGYVNEEKWEQLKQLLAGTLKIASPQAHSGTKIARWRDLSDWLPLLSDESKKKGRLSIHDDLIRARHTTGQLARVAPLKEYQDTDFLLYLHGPGTTGEGNDYGGNWYPRSLLLAQHLPHFIAEARNYSFAMTLCGILGIQDIEELKNRLLSSRRTLKYDRSSPISTQDIEAIGSEGGAQFIATSS